MVLKRKRVLVMPQEACMVLTSAPMTRLLRASTSRGRRWHFRYWKHTGLRVRQSQRYWDAFVARLNVLDGTEVWGQQLGTRTGDYGYGVAVGNGYVFVTGYTSGSLYGSSAGATDVYVARYNSMNGEGLWGRQFGTSLQDEVWDVAVDGGHVYLAGYTYGALGAMNYGSADVLLLSLSAETTSCSCAVPL